ncbi:hypothetical protein G3545_04060 [Starkeya sp. ORNL1]|uniref:hypothetical protein n=1 Tax=Starkeya sp. ORNL1 TaxID=2709380 RepID=UPI001464611A|nr:hypothetical protein [Starkeya sp. ORNL1]QJP12908.1 hypothetical protein G3545_04060 [Starkeya sp. ORNL1]
MPLFTIKIERVALSRDVAEVTIDADDLRDAERLVRQQAMAGTLHERCWRMIEREPSRVVVVDTGERPTERRAA